jgi:hypothetical protein
VAEAFSSEIVVRLNTKDFETVRRVETLLIEQRAADAQALRRWKWAVALTLRAPGRRQGSSFG